MHNNGASQLVPLFLIFILRHDDKLFIGKSRLTSKSSWKSTESTIFLLLRKEVETNRSLAYVDQYKVILIFKS